MFTNVPSSKCNATAALRHMVPTWGLILEQHVQAYSVGPDAKAMLGDRPHMLLFHADMVAVATER